MFCKNCGAEITENEKFCGKCGTSISEVKQGAITGEKFETPPCE